MKLKNIICILCIITIILVMILFTLYFTSNNVKLLKNINNNDNNDKNWFQQKSCNFLITDTIINILNESNNKLNKNLYIPCLYDNIFKEYDDFPVDKNGVYFLIDNINVMIDKKLLYSLVLNKYNEEKTLSLMPKSYILPDDQQQFIYNYDPKKIYIMKRNIQRQNGLKISRNLEDILNDFNKYKNDSYPYVIIQELLQDPYLIDGRKINLRVYVLVTRENDQSNLYVYNDGFMYYTAKKYESNSDDHGVNVTTGYIDRQVYIDNPLTHGDFKKYLVKTHNTQTSDLVFNNIYKLISDVFSVFIPHVGNSSKLYNNLKFQLFGVDVAIDDKFGAKIMEINKGPDLGAKDLRDSELKHDLVRNMFNIVGLTNFNIPNNMIQLAINN